MGLYKRMEILMKHKRGRKVRYGGGGPETWSPRWKLRTSWYYTDTLLHMDCLHGVMLMSVLDKVFAKASPTSSGRTIDDPEFAAEFPVLFEVLSNTEPIEGKPRVTASMMIITEDGVAKAGLRDRQTNLSLWVSSETILGVFAALEKALSQSPVPWRKVPEAFQYRGARKS